MPSFELYHFTGINWLQLWENIHDKKHSPNIYLLVIKHPKILIFIQQIFCTFLQTLKAIYVQTQLLSHCCS